jgi:hypothetical protein
MKEGLTIDNDSVKEKVIENKLEDSAPIDIRFENIQNIFSKCEENGIFVTSEIAADIVKNEIGITLEEFLDKKIEDPGIKKSFINVPNEINEMMSQKAEERGTTLSSLRNILSNKPLLKAAILSTILFFKFNGAALAGNDGEDKNLHKNNTETESKVKKVAEVGGDGDKDTYDATKHFDDSKKSTAEGLKESYEINMTNSFDVDKADISKEDAGKIKKDFHSFLDKINPSNFKQFIESKKVISASSDERATKFGAEDKKEPAKLENNIFLTDERILAGENILMETVNEHDFSKSGLSENQIKEIKSSMYEHKVPEKGYTKITELNKTDPKTGEKTSEKYTDKEVEEIKKNDPKLYDQLTKECRYVKADFMVQYATNIEKINQFDRAIIFGDITPSTEHTMLSMAKTFKELAHEQAKNGDSKMAKVDLVFYSDKIHNIVHADNIFEAGRILEKTESKGSNKESPFSAAIQYLKHDIETDKEVIKKGGTAENKVVYFTTDEGLQDIQNLQELSELLIKANVQEGNAYILMYPKDGSKPFEKKISDLINEINNKIEIKIEHDALVLEQQKISSEDKLNNLVSKIIKEVNPKTLQEVLGQENIGNENEIAQKLLTQKLITPKLESSEKSRTESHIIWQLNDAKYNLFKINNLLEKTKNQTVENYLKTTNTQIKVFTDENGKKFNFDIWGDKNNLIAENIEL